MRKKVCFHLITSQPQLEVTGFKIVKKMSPIMAYSTQTLVVLRIFQNMIKYCWKYNS